MLRFTVTLTELLPFACLAVLFGCKLGMLVWNLAEVLRLSQPVQAN